MLPFLYFIPFLDTALSFKIISIILVILRKPLFLRTAMQEAPLPVFVSFYRSYKMIFAGGDQMRQRLLFDFRLNFRYAKMQFILLICNILRV